MIQEVDTDVPDGHPGLQFIAEYWGCFTNQEILYGGKVYEYNEQQHQCNDGEQRIP